MTTIRIFNVEAGLPILDEARRLVIEDIKLPRRRANPQAQTSMTTVRIFNVEAGLPILDEARRLVIEEIKRAKREGIRVLKVIHGYGSSGKGGALYVGLRKSFRLRKKEGVI